MWFPRRMPFRARQGRNCLKRRGSALGVLLCLVALGLGAAPGFATVVKLGSVPIGEEAGIETEARLESQHRMHVGGGSCFGRTAEGEGSAEDPRAASIGRHRLQASRQLAGPATHLVGSGIKLRC